MLCAIHEYPSDTKLQIVMACNAGEKIASPITLFSQFFRINLFFWKGGGGNTVGDALMTKIQWALSWQKTITMYHQCPHFFGRIIYFNLLISILYHMLAGLPL